MMRFLSIFFFVSIQLHAAIDLEQITQPYVLGTQQIIVPEYPHAFNPSIIRWNNKLLLSFRVIPDPKQSFTSWIGLVWLNENFEPIGKLQKLPLRQAESTVPPRAEDGRLIAVNNHLYMVYSDNEDRIISKGGFRVYIAELVHDGEAFSVKHIERMSDFEDNNLYRREKNWVPFEFFKELLLAYSISPHKILHPVFGANSAETVTCSDMSVQWNWGELRGGTPALLDGDTYLAFFHSAKKMASVQSKGKEMLHYFMGAYRFSKKFPFALTHVSKEPIVGEKFYTSPEYKPYWHPVKVVFPGGFVFNENKTTAYVVYGREDHEMWVAAIDTKQLYQDLVAVRPVILSCRMSFGD